MLLVLSCSCFSLGQTEKLNEFVRANCSIKQIAFTNSGGWCILEGKNGYYYNNIPQPAANKLVELYKRQAKLDCIAFYKDYGWCILFDDYGYRCDNIPQAAISKLRELNYKKIYIKHIAFTNVGGWCILEGKNGYWYDKIPQAAINKLNELHQRRASIQDIAFTENGGWCVIFNGYGYWCENIPQEAVNKLMKLNSQKASIKKIEFHKNDCYILYNNTYWKNTRRIETYNKPPEITILEPDISRGFQVVSDKTIKVAGRAVDADGISSVTINSVYANLKNDGYFWRFIPLKQGDNSVTVVATDKNMKSSTKKFIVKQKANINIYKPKGKRVALVLGNSNYSQAANLGVNSINDARDMASTLMSLGFDVMLKTEANLITMNNSIREFGRQNKDADIALFYFAGHGIQVDKINYLLPLGVNISSKDDVSFECVSVSTIQKVMESSNTNKLNLIILDACRNNPFKNWERGGETGLAPITPPGGTLIAFATSPGSTASNGTGRNGLYTGELIKQLKIPQRIEDIFINTRNAVERKSGGRQSPWELSRLRGAYYLTK